METQGESDPRDEQEIEMATATRTRKTRKTGTRKTSAARKTASPQDVVLSERADAALAAPDLPERLVAALTRQTVNPALSIGRYSLRNQALLLDQADERGMQLTAVASYNQWREIGRQVRKGEKALWIVRPVGREDKKSDDNATPPAADAKPAMVDDEAPVRFRGMTVFDITQTDGFDDLAAGDATDETSDTGETPDPLAALLASLRVQAERDGYTVTTGDRAAVDTDTKTLTVPAEITPETVKPLVGAVSAILAARAEGVRTSQRAALAANLDAKRKPVTSPVDDVETFTVL
jgi:hypothetical protein